MTRPVLTREQLNRATLARQLLLERSTMGVVEAVGRLAAVQAQDSVGPYHSLFARLEGFDRAELTEQITARRVLIGSLHRLTIHMVTAVDYPWIRATLASMLETRSRARTTLSHVDLDRLSRRAVAGLPARLPDLRRLAPDEDPIHVGTFLQAHLPLVRVPPAGVWRVGGSPVQELAAVGQPDVPRLVRSYLAAYGPAGVRDAQTWSGMTRLGPVFDRLHDLVQFEAEDGTVLYDLADAPRPPADTPAPVRFLGRFDNLLLGHADRTRVIPAGLPTMGVVGAPAVLVDGMVAGSWEWDGVDVTVTPKPSGRWPRREVEAERRRLRDWLGAEP